MFERKENNSLKKYILYKLFYIKIYRKKYFKSNMKYDFLIFPYLKSFKILFIFVLYFVKFNIKNYNYKWKINLNKYVTLLKIKIILQKYHQMKI